MLPSQTVENYLKTIHLAQMAQTDRALVPMGQLAAALGVVPGTATTMMKALAESGLVHYEPYMGVRLTSAGEDFVEVYSETGKAILGGILTSAVGFGAMLLADHPGLNSIGQMANMGFALNLVVMLLGFPALLLPFLQRRSSFVNKEIMRS